MSIGARAENASASRVQSISIQAESEVRRSSRRQWVAASSFRARRRSWPLHLPEALARVTLRRADISPLRLSAACLIATVVPLLPALEPAQSEPFAMPTLSPLPVDAGRPPSRFVRERN